MPHPSSPTRRRAPTVSVSMRATRDLVRAVDAEVHARRQSDTDAVAVSRSSVIASIVAKALNVDTSGLHPVSNSHSQEQRS